MQGTVSARRKGRWNSFKMNCSVWVHGGERASPSKNNPVDTQATLDLFVFGGIEFFIKSRPELLMQFVNSCIVVHDLISAKEALLTPGVNGGLWSIPGGFFFFLVYTQVLSRQLLVKLLWLLVIIIIISFSTKIPNQTRDCNSSLRQ